MNRNQYDIIKKQDSNPVLVYATELSNKENRTLLYGYTCERYTWHLYLEDMEFVFVMYDHQNRILRSNTSDVLTEYDSIVPDKRLYPAACDYEFCTILKKVGYDLPFTTFNDREDIRYHGKRIDQLKPRI